MWWRSFHERKGSPELGASYVEALTTLMNAGKLKVRIKGRVSRGVSMRWVDALVILRSLHDNQQVRKVLMTTLN